MPKSEEWGWGYEEAMARFEDGEEPESLEWPRPEDGCTDD